MSEFESKKLVHKIMIIDGKFDIGLCWGLAPRPNGFTFDATGLSKHYVRMINKLLKDIESDSVASAMLKRYMRGERV